MKTKFTAISLILVVSCSLSTAQVTLSGTSYSQEFNSVGSGLPSGWGVYTTATGSTFGTIGSFTTDPTSWATATVGTEFRNVASDSLTYTTTGATQASHSDRAIGWRPVGNAGTQEPSREGAVMFTIEGTSGFENFSLSVDLFTVNITGNSNSYQLEFRVGESGEFTALGSYSTPTDSTSDYANQTSLTASSVTLSGMNNQAENVYIRLRGTSTTGSSSQDLVAIDSFLLNFSAVESAVPEPSTFAALLGLGALGFAASRRRGRNAVALAA